MQIAHDPITLQAVDSRLGLNHMPRPVRKGRWSQAYGNTIPLLHNSSGWSMYISESTSVQTLNVVNANGTAMYSYASGGIFTGWCIDTVEARIYYVVWIASSSTYTFGYLNLTNAQTTVINANFAGYGFGYALSYLARPVMGSGDFLYSKGTNLYSLSASTGSLTLLRVIPNFPNYLSRDKRLALHGTSFGLHDSGGIKVTGYLDGELFNAVLLSVVPAINPVVYPAGTTLSMVGIYLCSTDFVTLRSATISGAPNKYTCRVYNRDEFDAWLIRIAEQDLGV